MPHNTQRSIQSQAENLLSAESAYRLAGEEGSLLAAHLVHVSEREWSNPCLLLKQLVEVLRICEA
jgi:energy-converting hydrogenase Eha subunit B